VKAGFTCSEWLVESRC